MCKLAKAEGAIPTGIDIEKSYIDDAKKLSPDIPFYIKDGYNTYSQSDIILMSGTIHYLTDYISFFKRMSIIVKEIMLLDIWLDDDNTKPAFYLSHRNSFIPNKLAFEEIVKRYFKVVESKGKTSSPDNSNRFIYHLKEPIKNPPKAVLIYGEGNTGKSFSATELLGYEIIRLDDVFIWWATAHRDCSDTSIVRLVERAMASETLKKEYLDFHRDWLRKRLIRGFNVVIEGYDMINIEHRNMVIELLKELGWTDIEERHLTFIY